MHYTPHLLIMLLVNFSVVSAQTNQHFYRVNFNTDEAKLDADDKVILDKIHSDYLKGNYGEIILTAHTDADAAETYNMNLSQKRADVVTQYLTEKGIHQNRLSVKWYGERRPEKSNNDAEGKAINRRVDITLKSYRIQNSGELVQAVAPEYKQTYTIHPATENTIKGKNGTTVVIPKNALQTKTGKPLTAEKIDIVLEEFLTPKDAAFNQLATVCDGRMLESGGMFSIKAYAADEEVVLKKGKKMQVEMPTINMKPGMELFTAVQTADGITEWKTTSVPFLPKPVNPDPVIFTTLDTKYLRSLIVDLPEFDVEKMEYSYVVPVFPTAPLKPKAKPIWIEPTKQNMFSWYVRWFVPEFMLHQKIATEYERRLKIYHNQLSRYNKRLAVYENAYDQYIIDSTEFEKSTHDTLQNWLRTQRAHYADYVQYLETKQWNSALGQMIYLSENEQLTSQNPEGLFAEYIKGIGRRNYDREKYIQALYRIDFLLGQSMMTIVQEHAVEGLLMPMQTRASFLSGLDFKNTFVDQQLSQNPALTLALREAQKDIQRKRKKAGITDTAKESTSYTTTLTDFGTFNCDRFRNIPPAQMATITIPYLEEARVSFYIAGTNSYMYAGKTEEGYTATLPKGLTIKVVLVAFDRKDGPRLAIEQMTLTDSKVLQLQPNNVNLDELHKAIASL